jgi:hypothetical protein
LEHVVVATIDERDREVRAPETTSRVESAEPAADNHDPRHASRIVEDR